MRLFVTGGAGFVGSNVAAVAADLGHDVVCAARVGPANPDPRCTYVPLDLLDRAAVRETVQAARPDAIVHTAILNDFTRIYAERQLGWDAYVGVTASLADAANEAAALLVYVSSDWVFDGTQAPAAETTPPNPINLYGFLKAASELVALERAREAAVARISGVMGTHRAGAGTPRTQDAGFGYFVASLVETLSSAEPYTVWESEGINMRATPSLASHSAELLVALAERRLTGVFHCCGKDAATRMQLALAAAEIFDLDAALIRSGPPDPAALPPAPVPYDTSLDASATAAALDVELPSLPELLERFQAERSI